jgi:hypothetical protein
MDWRCIIGHASEISSMILMDMILKIKMMIVFLSHPCLVGACTEIYDCDLQWYLSCLIQKIK